MSELNGENGPQNLPRLRQALKVFRRTMRHKIRVKRRAAASMGPRQICRICGGTFDFVPLPKDAKLVASLCSTCKKNLAEGWTACVSITGAIFVRMKGLDDMAGKIIEMSPANLEIVRQRYNVLNIGDANKEEKPKDPPTSP